MDRFDRRCCRSYKSDGRRHVRYVMKRAILLGVIITGLHTFLYFLHSHADAADAKSVVDFNSDSGPILSKNCYACHGPDAKSRTTKMRLDQRESAIARKKDGTAPIVPGKPNESELIRRVSSNDESDQMPPKDG